MNKEDYDQKMTALLNDRSTYRVLERTPLTRLNSLHRTLIRKLNTTQELDTNTKTKLLKSNGTLGRIYGAVKTHKTNKPLRPIISMRGTTTYDTSKYLADILRRSITNHEYTIINSNDLVEKLKQIRIPDGYILTSFDVVSMFTNIPLDHTLKLIDEKWNSIAVHTTIKKASFLELIKLLFNNCYFTYKQVTYQQIRGLPMGSSISPVLADLVLNELIITTVEKLDYTIPFMGRYVDDLILILPERQVASTLELFNSYHPDIQFTAEMEQDNKINFLELTIERQPDGTVDTDWYRKEIASLRCLNFYSNHSIQQKRNIVLMYQKKIYELSAPQHIYKNLAIAKKILLQNNYPMFFIKRYLYRRNNITSPQHQPIGNQTQEEEPTPISYYRIPYIDRVATKLKKIIENQNNKLVFYNKKTTRAIHTKLKDKIDTNLKSNVVYRFPCSCGKHYYGQTRQYISSRIKQHQYDVKRCKTKGKNHTSLTGVMKHINEHPDHVMKFDEVEVVEQEPNYRKRLLYEAWHITKTKGQNINLQSDTDGHIYSNTYRNLIHKL